MPPAPKRLFPAILAVLLASTGAGLAEPVEYPAILAGHALIPAATFVVPPADAPRGLMVSGRYAGPGGTLNERIGTVEGTTWLAPPSAPRGTGMFLPFAGQPVQGFSGVSHVGDGLYWTLQDNGFGSKANSVDAMLIAHKLRPDWSTGRVERVETIFLRDPDGILPFPIANALTAERYLTGADLDVESIQPVGGLLWFGDEFGPYLVATDGTGKVVFATETTLGDRTLRSPDHPAVTTPATPGPVAFEVRRSRGFEGMAAAPDGSRLYPLLEGPIVDAATGAFEAEDGVAFLRLLEFDPAARAWTGRHWRYPLADAAHFIGDFNMISETRGLVVERDGGEGVPELACPEGEARSDCFTQPAQFKRVFLIELGETGNGEMVEKLAYVDLMAIEDPDGIARTGDTAGEGGTFRFPFVTIENVDMVDGRHIIVGNDNNLPFSTGRAIGRADDNEWILVDVGGMLAHGE